MRTRIAPSLQQLEDRTVPADYRWAPGVILGDNNWHTPGNWDVKNAAGGWDGTDSVPTGGDHAIFPAGQQHCIVDKTTYIRTVSLSIGYASDLHLRFDLHIVDPTSAPAFNMHGDGRVGGQVVAGVAQNHGNIYLADTADSLPALLY